MQDPEILHNGRPVTIGYARNLAQKFAAQEGWDPLELSAVWGRLLDTKQAHGERLECAEQITRLTHDSLEFFVNEPA